MDVQATGEVLIPQKRASSTSNLKIFVNFCVSFLQPDVAEFGNVP
jgi:hypothetical protein